MIWYLASGDGDYALILYVCKYSRKAVNDEKSVTQHHACGTHAREMFREFMANDLHILVCYHQKEFAVLRKPLVDYEECLMCLTIEQVLFN